MITAAASTPSPSSATPPLTAAPNTRFGTQENPLYPVCDGRPDRRFML